MNREQREKWVNSVLYMLDLEPIENDLVRDHHFTIQSLTLMILLLRLELQTLEA